MDEQHLLETALSDNSSEREFFLRILALNLKAHYDKTIESLVDIMVNANGNYNLRAIAAYSLKMNLYSDGDKWLQMDAKFRKKIQKKLVSTFSQDGIGKHLSALIISAIIYIDCQHDICNPLLDNLISTSTTVSKPAVTEASLIAMIYVYMDVGEKNIERFCKSLLDAIVFCINPRWDIRINLAACLAMTFGIEYAKDHLSVVNQGNNLIKSISDCIDSLDERLNYLGLECITLLACAYYDSIINYLDSELIEKITSLTKHRSPVIVIKSIYFWSALSVIELERVESNIKKINDELPVYYYSKQALPYTIPYLFEILSPDVTRGDDMWSIYDEIYEYLDNTVQLCFDEASELLLPLIEQKFNHADKCRRDASMITLGILIKHCNSSCIDSLVSNTFPLILTSCNDPSKQVRESAFWALGNIYNSFTIITRYVNEIQQSLSILFTSVDDVPQVTFNVLRALMFIVRGLFKYTRECTTEPDTNLSITKDYRKLLDIVYFTLQRSDVDQSHLRQACIGLMKNLIMFHPDNTHQLLIDNVEDLVKKYSAFFLISMKTILQNQYFEFLEINTFYNEALQESFKALEINEVTQLFPTMFWTILNFFTLTEDSLVKEQLLGSLNVLVTYASDGAVLSILTDALPILLNICKNVSDMPVSSASLTVIYSICMALGTSMAYYCNSIIYIASKYLSLSYIDFQSKLLALKILKILIISMDVQSNAIVPEILEALDGLNIKTIRKDDSKDVISEYERFLYKYFDTYSNLLPPNCQKEKGKFTLDSYLSWTKYIPNIIQMIDKISDQKFLGQEVVRMYCSFFGVLFVTSKKFHSSSDMKQLFDKLVEQALNSGDKETQNMAILLLSLVN